MLPAPPPPFAALVLAALDAVGVSYVSMELLRKAKRGAADERERRELWKLLHDLVLVVLADFAVDADELRRMNAPRELEAALWDADAQRVREELVRFYLYDWGFVCRGFYGATSATSADLLLALAWLLASAQFFERLHAPILARWAGAATESSALVRPPYPNDVVLSDAQVEQALSSVLAAQRHTDDSPAPPFEATIHQLHAAFGRLQGHVSDLAAQRRCHRRLLLRLEAAQGRADDQRDALLPAFALQLVTQPKAALELHVRVLAQRVQMLEDEKLFYKWVNSLVASYDATAASAAAAGDAPPLAAKFPALHAQVSSTHALFREHAAALEQLAQSFEREWRRWQQAKRASQLPRMAAKMARIAQDVRARELFDPLKLFAQSAQSWATQRGRQALLAGEGNAAAAPPPLPRERDLASLRRQLTQVTREIAAEYCGAQLR